MELPEQFLENMKQLLSREEYQAYCDSYREERVYGLRVNTAKLSASAFQKSSPFSLEPIPWIPNGFYYTGSCKPAKHPYYYAGLYYLQEPSAMTPAHVLPIEPGDRVLDLCAAPGGKSTELAARLKGSGVLVSNDISNSRAKALLKNLELFGIPNALILSEAPHRLAETFSGYFDKILIDAPCSGEGMFRKEPSVIKSWLEHGNDYFVKLQREITAQALKMLRPGGMLLYSTCTFSPLEDEQMIAWLLSLDPTLSLVEPEWYEGFDHGHPEWADGNPALTCCVRIWPHRMKGEGHFLALLQKEDSRTAMETEIVTPLEKHRTGKNAAMRLTEQKAGECRLPDTLLDFLAQTGLQLDPARITLREEKALYEPEYGRNLKGLRILRSGLLLGECRKNRFEPSQALAMTLTPEQYPNHICFSVEDERVIRYLKGETLEVSDLIEKPLSGWVLLCVEQFPLGFGKGQGTTIKNKYLAGWRWM